MKVTEFPSISTLADGQVLVVDGEGGTKQIPVTDVLFALEHLQKPAISHRNTFRGKNLGTAVTSAQWAAIANSTFDDLWLGDYWVINNITWRIADFNYWLRCGNTDFTQPHLAIVPDKILYNAQMNTSNTTTGGYTGSEMYKTNLASAKTTINSAFGSGHVLSHKLYLTNAVTNGYPSGGGWVASTVELMSESQVYGHPHLSPAVAYSSGTNVIVPNLYTVDYLQLALFAQAPEFVRTRDTYWLRDVVSATYFALVLGDGAASHNASDSLGVRPVFAIG